MNAVFGFNTTVKPDTWQRAGSVPRMVKPALSRVYLFPREHRVQDWNLLEAFKNRSKKKRFSDQKRKEKKKVYIQVSN